MTDLNTVEPDRFRLTLGTNYEKELLTDSAIDPEVARERGYLSLMRPRPNYDNTPKPGMDSREFLNSLGFPTWSTREDYYFPGLWMPGYDALGQRLPGQWKPNNPVSSRDGRKMKYASAKGRASYVDVHPRWTRDPDPDGRDTMALPAIKDPARPLWVTEGIKKADSLTSRGVVTVALSGVYNWRGTHGTLPDWEDVRIKDREVVICFDADTLMKVDIQKSMARAGRWFKQVKRAAKVGYLVVPGMVNGMSVKGVDDYFAAGGTITELERAITDKVPFSQSTEDRFTDSALSEQAVAEVLSERYVNVTNVGWYHRDTGSLWTPCADAGVLEAVREWARDNYVEAIQEQAEAVRRGHPVDPFEADAWRKVQSASKLGAILKLAAGNAEILRDLDDFDTYADLLLTPAGPLDLTTGEVLAHDATYMFTKITAVNYVPGATHEAFTTAMEAVPTEAQTWLQTRLGQAITGYEPDDERLTLLTGGGENGKTTLLNAIYGALGGGKRSGYAAAVPNTLLMKGNNKGGATPEKMTLQGVRLAYIEETPEGRFLDTQVLKEVIGTPTITGRKLFKDFVEFRSSHSMFLNTNHLPQVSETDHGTWRRLIRLNFPYKFVKRAEQVTDPSHRVGDATLKKRLESPEAQRAALAWLVEGARRWYACGRSLRSVENPACVEESTSEWREGCDVMYAFIVEGSIEFDRDSWVASQDLYATYTRWLRARGYKDMSSNTFTTKFLEHPEVPQFVAKKQVKIGVNTPAPSRPVRSSGTWLVEGADALPELGTRPMGLTGVRFA